MQRSSQPLPWRPRGLSDSMDGSTAFNGSMSSLQNLIPDPSTSQLWECRPAAALIYDTTQPGPISVFKIVGSILYGMVGEIDGFDHPFAFNLATNTVVTVTGVVAGSIPQSQPASGAWIPPVMDLIGAKMVVAHTGFSATVNFIGWFDISTPTAPVWHAGNMTGTQVFTVPPISVAQFANRAYYIHNAIGAPAVIFSDILNATNDGTGGITPVITFGDSTPLTALGQLRLYNQLGGIIQALIVFKDSINVYQVTGDAATSNLAVNAMNFATGTKAPNSVCSTPRGLAFVAPDGLRIIDFSANISDPIGYDGQGICVPFIYSNVPSRICAACNGNIVRITTQNANAIPVAFQEYWYDLERKIWSGPHTCAAQFIQPFGGTFITALQASAAKLWQSDSVIGATSTFTENGAALSWTYTTTFLPDTDMMGNIHVSQALLDCAFSANSAPFAVVCQDQNNTPIDSIALAGLPASTVWGVFIWGAATWGGPGNALSPRKLPWHFPLVFSKGKFAVTGASTSEIRLGTLHLRYKQLRYLTDISAAA